MEPPRYKLLICRLNYVVRCLYAVAVGLWCVQTSCNVRSATVPVTQWLEAAFAFPTMRQVHWHLPLTPPLRAPVKPKN